MITLPNKLTGMKKPQKEGEAESFFTYGDLIAFACETTSQPVSLAEQRFRFKIIDACESSNGEIELDEKWIPVLKKCIDGIAAPVSREFVEFGDSIENLNPTK